MEIIIILDRGSAFFWDKNDCSFLLSVGLFVSLTHSSSSTMGIQLN